MHETRRVAAFARAQVAGIEASTVHAAASYLHGKLAARWLPASLRFALRHLLERRASLGVGAELTALTTASRSVAEEAAARGAVRLVSRGTGATVATTAVRQIASGVGRASAAGFVIDGAVGSVEAYRAYRAGTMSRGEALRHAGVEGVTGAVACGAGVALAAGVVVATGGIAPVTVFALAAVSSTGVKLGLRKLVLRRNPKLPSVPPLLEGLGDRSSTSA